MKLKRAFTLIELLVVIAIIAILAAILFPVFAQAKVAAKSTAWLSNCRQTAMGTQLYMIDAEDKLPFVNRGGSFSQFTRGLCWGCGRPDYTWFELVEPYMKNWDISYCSGDAFSLEQRHIDGYTNQTIGPTHENYWYSVASRANMGYNYEFMSPWVLDTAKQYLGSAPQDSGSFANHSATIMQVDSVWDRTSSGVPTGGGNWVVEPPCVYDAAGQLMEPMNQLNTQGLWRHYTPIGWTLNTNPNSWLQFGGAWPWFNKRFRTTMLDTSVRTMAVGQLAAGCDLRPLWAGRVLQPEKYMWDNQ